MSQPSDPTGDDAPRLGTDPDRLFGEVAVRLFLLTRRDLDRGLLAQKKARDAGGTPNLGEVLEGLGLLGADQVAAVLRAQQIYDENNVETLYGRLAIKNGFVTEKDIEVAVKIQQRVGQRLRIGEILVKKSYMTWEQHESILRAQERILMGIEELKGKTDPGGA
jgi:hypothetical protein